MFFLGNVKTVHCVYKKKRKIERVHLCQQSIEIRKNKKNK